MLMLTEFLISCNNIDSSKYGILSDSKEANIIENVINIVGIPGKRRYWR